MFPVFLCNICQLAVGTIYPSFASYKAIQESNKEEYSRWMMYWVCFGIFSTIEMFTDIILGFWFPFYYEVKIMIVAWLVSPFVNGAETMYHNILNPQLDKKEELIDSFVVVGREIGVDTFTEVCRQVVDVFNYTYNNMSNALILLRNRIEQTE